MTHAHETAIEAVDLVKRYGDVTALSGLSFSVRAGTVFGLLGPNGAGKSTTIKILTTLSRPTSGSATVAGVDVLARPNDVRRAIGVVTQKTGADPQLTGRENLLLVGHVHGMRGRAAKQRVDELLALFDLTEAANRLVKQYSGGMQRKLDVAMGLVHRPTVLFLDEPTTGLDPQARSEMWSEIARLARSERLTILLTTHYLEEADHLADQLVIVDRGRLVAEGSPEELKSELRGDAVVIDLSPEASVDAARTAIEGLAGTREITVSGRTIRTRVDHGASAVPAALAALERSSVAVAAVTVARPALDDVYLRYTGRTFASADASKDQLEVAR
ncbi:ABC transporter ATP-binding protein [Actinophytocola sp.]|uniref:ABC transporter ATP-binding protein n=1 Tax=Actinophytocola sp. TaxID=1872138 RepID=UPI002D235CDE|nr:ATP-binding cassette domain-containing protein [Actinophytocola sp.]HYQ69720.1 ATP-binding cassette domain-containing protein [Actinophytocola sp.]